MTHANRNLRARITSDNVLLADLEWDEHPDHHPAIYTTEIVTDSIRVERQLGGVTQVTYRPIELQIEDGGTLVVYPLAAMEAAIRRSIQAGGGVRGMSSQFLRDGDAVQVPTGATTVQDVRRAWERHAAAQKRAQRS